MLHLSTFCYSIYVKMLQNESFLLLYSVITSYIYIYYKLFIHQDV